MLGPLLFLLNINDICSCCSRLGFCLFADDTNLLYSHKNLKTLERIVNDELANVYNWLTSNKLSLNLKKSNFVIFCPYQKELPFTPKLYIYDPSTNKQKQLECREFVEYLGVLIDYKLSWNNHIDTILLKISRTVGLLSKLRHFALFPLAHLFPFITL